MGGIKVLCCVTRVLGRGVPLKPEAMNAKPKLQEYPAFVPVDERTNDISKARELTTTKHQTLNPKPSSTTSPPYPNPKPYSSGIRALLGKFWMSRTP